MLSKERNKWTKEKQTSVRDNSNPIKVIETELVINRATAKKKIKAKKYKKGCFFHELKKFIKTCLARVTAMCKYFKHLPFPNSRRRAKTLNKKVFGKKEASSTDDNQKELGDNVNYR